MRSEVGRLPPPRDAHVNGFPPAPRGASVVSHPHYSLAPGASAAAPAHGVRARRTAKGHACKLRKRKTITTKPRTDIRSCTVPLQHHKSPFRLRPTVRNKATRAPTSTSHGPITHTGHLDVDPAAHCIPVFLPPTAFRYKSGRLAICTDYRAAR